MLACRITGCKGGRNIVTAGVSVNIQNFTAEEEAGHQLGFHAFGLDFLEADAAACHEGLLQRTGARRAERELLESR